MSVLGRDLFEQLDMEYWMPLNGLMTPQNDKTDEDLFAFLHQDLKINLSQKLGGIKTTIAGFEIE